MHKLTTEAVAGAMTDGDFNKDITASHSHVAVILTESWCPQWLLMRKYLEHMDTDNIYFYLYDKSEIFDEFTAFKETVFENDEIPYLRFYKNGQLVSTCNFISPDELKQRLK